MRLRLVLSAPLFNFVAFWLNIPNWILKYIVQIHYTFFAVFFLQTGRFSNSKPITVVNQIPALETMNIGLNRQLSLRWCQEVYRIPTRFRNLMGIHNSAYSELLSRERLEFHDVFNILLLLCKKRDSISEPVPYAREDRWRDTLIERLSITFTSYPFFFKTNSLHLDRIARLKVCTWPAKVLGNYIT